MGEPGRFAAIIAWVAALTVTSYVAFSPIVLRAIQVLVAAAVGVRAARQIRLPIDQRSAPIIMAVGSILGAMVLAVITMIGPER